MFCCEINQVSSSQRIEYQPTPLKLKIIQKLGLSNFAMDKLVFIKSPSNYKSKVLQKQNRLFIEGQPYIAPYGYTYQYCIVNCQNHSIPVVYLKCQQGVASTIIYSHGNASNLTQSLHFVSTLAQLHKANYVAYDYTGYGNSQYQQTTPSSICEDLEIILAWINQPLESIVFIGFSLGCFPTAKTASRHKIKAIILMAPMASLISLFEQKLTPFTFFKDDEFNLLEIVQNIESHILIAHSRDDQLIPFRHSQIIYQRYTQISKNPSIQLLQLRRMKHNQMYYYLASTLSNTFKRKFLKFLKQVQEKQTVEHYIYASKKLQSQKKGKLNSETKELLKKQSINRQNQHISISKHHFLKLRSQIKISKPANTQ